MKDEAGVRARLASLRDYLKHLEAERSDEEELTERELIRQRIWSTEDSISELEWVLEEE